MIIIALFVSCLFMLTVYWNSYMDLYTNKLTSAKSLYDNYNVIIVPEDVEAAKQVLLKDAVPINKLFKYIHRKEQTTNENAPNVTLIIKEGSNPKMREGVYRLLNRSRIARYSVLLKCIKSMCQYVNLTFKSIEEKSDTPPVKPTEPTMPKTVSTKTKPSLRLDTKTPVKIIDQPPLKSLPLLNTNIFKEKSTTTTTIWQYLKTLGFEEKLIFKYPRIILSFSLDRVTLPIVVITSYLFSALVYCFLWKTTKHSYGNDKREQNIPGIQNSLTNMIKILAKISKKQEKMNHLVMSCKYFDVIDKMHAKVQKFEDEVFTTIQRPEDDKMLSVITEQNSNILQTLNTALELEKNKKYSLNEERDYIKTLCTTETHLLLEIVNKLWSADLQLEEYIEELEILEESLECNDTVRVKIRGEIESLKQDRTYLLSFFEHPALLVMMIGKKELTDCLPSNFFDAHRL